MLKENVFSFENHRSLSRYKRIVLIPFIVLFSLFFLITLFYTNADAATRQLVFDPSPDTRVTGYLLYYGEPASSDINSFDINHCESTIVDLKNTTTHDLTDLKEGSTYYFAASAYDSTGKESALSDVLFYTVPVNDNTSYTINASAGPGGTITPSGNVLVAHGDSQTFTITPDTGQAIKDVSVNGTSVGTVDSYTFNNVTSDQTISVTFETITYTINASAGPGGTITPSGNVLVAHGDSQTFTITPDTGQAIKDVSVNGTSVGAVSSYTFSNMTSNQTISVTFETIISTEPEPITHIFEVGEVVVNHDWKRVDFAETYINPIVVAKPASLNDPDPAVVRIQNVNETGFEVRIQEWDYLNDIHGYETISYIVVEKGMYELPGGIIMEAGTFEADGNNSRFIPFSNKGDFSFTRTPVVIASVTSINQKNAVVGRMRNVSTNGFEYFLQREEKTKVKHGVETVSFIAIEPFSGVLNQMTVEVGRTGNQVNQNFFYLSYSEAFSNIPYFLADMQTTNDSETANVRWRARDIYGVEMNISEERSRDAELNHSNEDIGYVIISD
jgi:hypothetical protein